MSDRELLEVKALDRIAVADKPPALGGKVTLLSREEFNKKFGFEYTESLWGDASTLKKYLENKELHQQIKAKPDQPKLEKVLERIQKPLTCFAVCDMSQPGPINPGYGLFTTADIPPDTVLFFYSGIIEDGKPYEAGDAYATSWGSPSSKDATKCVSALKKGGLARFMQHLPLDNERHKAWLKEGLEGRYPPELLAAKGINLDTFVDEMFAPFRDNELDNVKFHSANVKSNLATNNVALCQVMIGNIPLVVCFTNYGLKKDEAIGFSYGSKYWLPKKISPCYFTKTGALIPKTAYTLRDDKIAESRKVECGIEKTGKYCFFNTTPEKVLNAKALQKVVGQSEIRVQEEKSRVYLSIDWLKELPEKALDELANGVKDKLGEREDIGVPREFLASICNR